MGTLHIVVVAAVTFLALGLVRRLFWLRRRAHWRRGGGGQRWFLGRFFDRIGASPEQRAQLEALQERLLLDFRALSDTRRTSLQELIEWLPGEALDEAALDRLGQRLSETTERLRTDLRQALAELHSTLTVEQRKTVASWLQGRRRGHRWT